MTGVNNLKNIPAYATEADPNYTYDTAEALQQAAPENYAQGFQPLETLPARWYNAMLHALSAQAQATFQLCTSMFNELKTVIEASGQDMSASRINQLKEAIDTLTKLEIATATKLGGVKSSASEWNVAVDPNTGVMSVNTQDASTSQKGLVQLNNTTASTSTTQALTAAQGKALRDTINDMDYTSPSASGNSTAFIDTISQTDGKISATKKTIPDASTSQKGLVQLNNTTSSTSTTQALTAAQGKALRDTINAMDYTSPSASDTSTSFIDTISQTDGKISATKKTIPDAGRGTAGLVTLPNEQGLTKYLRQDGSWTVPPGYAQHIYLKVEAGTLRAMIDSTGIIPSGWTEGSVTLPTASHVTSATYLRPADSTSTAVTADSEGNLTAHTLTLS